ncbi:MAG: hypothetical protein AAGN35_17785 [Bacteroidota bacterium]
MITIAPPQEEVIGLTDEDRKLLKTKIAAFRRVAIYLRLIAAALLGLITWLVDEFLEITDMYYLFLFSYGVLYLLTEWAFFKFFRDLKREIAQDKKVVWRGTLTKRFRRRPGPVDGEGPRGYIWKVSGREFVLQKNEFPTAQTGASVVVEQLPQSKIILRAQPLT